MNTSIFARLSGYESAKVEDFRSLNIEFKVHVTFKVAKRCVGFGSRFFLKSTNYMFKLIMLASRFGFAVHVLILYTSDH